MRTRVSSVILIVFVLLTSCMPAAGGSGTTSPAAGAAQAAATPSPAAAETTGFTLSSPEVAEGGALPVAYTCDGASATLALAWSGAPAGTQSYAVVMHHVAGPDDVHWYWVLYDIPASVTSLPKNSAGVGTLGTNSVNDGTEYAPPCSQGPGEKVYTYTVYALSAPPQFTGPASQIDRAALLEAIGDITLASAELHVTYARELAAGPATPAGDVSGQGEPTDGRTPPQAAIAACDGKAEQAACEFSSPKGTETGVCETVDDVLACSPQRGPDGGQRPGDDGNQPGGAGAGYNIEQAISDRAQGMTIAFDALAFLTGDLGADSFFPPGKVADFWGFQYLRDNDSSQMGHAGDFLTGAAMNVLHILTADQRAELVSLAESQVDDINEYGYMRFVLMDAFRRLLASDLPAGTSGLDEDAVKAYSAELYRLDGEISFARAQMMGHLITSMDATQLAYLDDMAGKGMLEWPDVEEPDDIRGLGRDVKVAVMTYAADLFSWYAGSVEADVYFCPERHGTYFGSFYLKDIPAMEDSDYAIPTDLTGEMGDAMLGTLTPDQAELITGLVDIQRPYLLGIVGTREQIAAELRRFQAGETADSAVVLSLMEEYGELDGAIVYNLAVQFTQVNQSLTVEQKAKLMALRQEMLGDLMYPTGAYLYSQPISMPEIPNTDFLFR